MMVQKPTKAQIREILVAHGLLEPRASDLKQNLTYLEWYKQTLPNGWDVPKHVEFLCGIVQRVLDGDLKRVCISTPPGHAKTDTITRRLPNYFGPKNPKKAIVMTGYAQQWAEKNLSLQARELARESGVLSSKSTALDEWYFTSGARVVVRGVGSPPTGINPIDLLICDDPISSPAQALSPVERENIHQWWKGGIVQRFWPDTKAIIIATRWHEDDLIGRIKAEESGDWEFINLPAIAGEDDPMGRKPGEALWPEKKPIEFLEKLRVEMGEREFEALFQGNPTPREGSFFHPDRIETVYEVPQDIRRVVAFDVAYSKDKGDWTVAVELGVSDYGIFILDVQRWQLEPGARDERMRAFVDDLGRGPCLVLLPEDPGAGKAQLDTWVRHTFLGHQVKGVRRSKNKEVTAGGLAAQVNNGNVRMMKAPWNRVLREELRTFPLGKNDDQVDALADAFNELTLKPKRHDWLI